MWPFSLVYRFFNRKHQPLEVAKSATILSIPAPREGGVRITLAEAKYYKEDEFKKLMDALCVVSYVMNSEEFKARVLLSNFTSTKLSSTKVYEKLMKASEGAHDDGDDHEFDLELEMYLKSTSRVIGYTYPSVLKIWTNRKYFTKFTPAEIAGNLVHEGCHKFGFDHESASDKNSVPYKVGEIVRELGEKYMKEALALRPQIEMSIR